MIIQLKQNLINQIAAGEVVERPASILKEIIENAIDAGANHIVIDIKNFGLKSIEVRDNGIGMTKEDTLIAVNPHTTSKITSLQDLKAISSMGFRGEALASITSVSKTKLISKSEQDSIATQVIVEGGVKKSEKKVQFPQGTCITVSDIFYNTPARKKFLKSQSTEYKHLIDTFIRYALAFPNIHFIFKHNKKETFNLPSQSSDSFNQEVRVRIQNLFKNKFLSDMVSVLYSDPKVKISGFISHPRAVKSSRTHQYIFLNKRPIEDRVISKAIIDSYKSFIPKGKYPPYVLFLDLDPKQVDVNVHPRKTEVRFGDTQYIFKTIFNAARQNLTKFLKQDSERALKEYKHLLSASQFKNIKKRRSWQKPALKKNENGSVGKSISFTQHLLHINEDQKYINNSPFQTMQVFHTYIILEKKDTLLIIDQHAASERVTFDLLKKQYTKKNIVTQKLLLPEMVDIEQGDDKILKKHNKLIENLGFSFSTFGESIYKIDEVPALLSKSDIKELFLEVLQELQEEFGKNKLETISNIEDHILATMSCHTSIRAGMKLETEEMNRLVKDLLACEHPYSCPHGRPIIWELNRTEIEKHVKRH